MLDINLTADRLSAYYDTRFFDDMKHLYEFTEESGVTILGRRKSQWVTHAPLFLVLPELFNPDASDMNPVPKETWIPQSYEQELYFLALLAYVFAAEHMVRIRYYREEWMDAARRMNEFGFPWISAVLQSDIDSFVFRDVIYTREEALALRDTMDLVIPFMNEKLHPCVEGVEHSVEEIVTEAMVRTYRRFYEYHGLLGLDFSRDAVLRYYNWRFSKDFKKYFTSATQENGYQKVLYVDFHQNKRWDDGMPGRNASENMIFAAILLYQYIAQQSVIRKAGPDIETAYHEYSGWPMIRTGPGGGPCLHPLGMLAHAGLMPRKNETHLFLQAVQVVFANLRPELNSVLNGRCRHKWNMSPEEKASEETFLNAIRGRNRVKFNIRKYMDAEEQNIPALLLKWETSPSRTVSAFLNAEGIPMVDNG